MSLTKEQIARISLLVLKGYTLTDVAKLYNCSYSKIALHFRFDIRPKTKIYLGYKKEMYYENEYDYGRMPTYTFDELSKEEKEFYYNFKQTNKQKNEHRTTMV